MPKFKFTFFKLNTHSMIHNETKKILSDALEELNTNLNQLENILQGKTSPIETLAR